MMNGILRTKLALLVTDKGSSAPVFIGTGVTGVSCDCTPVEPADCMGIGTMGGEG